MKRAVLVLALAGLVLGASAGLWWRSSAPEPVQRADFSLPDLDGTPRHIADWAGKLVLVNFWATWCTPCLKEIPLLIDAQTRHGPSGLQVIGPALDEAELVRDYAQRQGINYPVLVGETDIIAVMDALGDTVGGLPFTVMIGRDGHILARHSGALSASQLEQLIADHL